jgi:AcrR family transcriptional regulator
MGLTEFYDSRTIINMPRVSRKATATPRTYDNRLREEQARQTRQRIVEAVAEVLATGATSFAMADVAARAKVSEPTLYRHFPSRDALLDAAGDWLNERLGAPPMPATSDDFVPSVAALFAYFARNEDLVRAALHPGVVRELRARAARRRDAVVRTKLHDLTDHLDDRRAHAVAAMVRRLMGGETYLELRDRFGLTPEEVSEVTTWAVGCLLDGLRRHRASRRPALVDAAADPQPRTRRR